MDDDNVHGSTARERKLMGTTIVMIIAVIVK